MRRFRLFAWFSDGSDIISGRFDPMKWSVDPEADGNADLGEVSIWKFPTASTPAEVRATKSDDESIFDQIKLTRWASPEAAKSSGDVVAAPHQLGDPPSVVLLEEHPAGQPCRWGRAWAFVGAAAVGEQTDNPCSLSFFSANKGMGFNPNISGTLWTSPGALVNLDPKPLLLIPATVYIAITGRHAASLLPPPNPEDPNGHLADLIAKVEAQAKVDVNLVNRIYGLNRVGIRVDVNGYVRLSPQTGDLLAEVGAEPYSCVAPRSLPAARYDPARVSIYYVDHVDYPPDPLHPSVRGITCHYWYSGNPAVLIDGNPGKGPVVYISYDRHSNVTLAHELGHVLGLQDELGRLGSVNVMHNLLPDGPLGADARSRLTVGQAFRMNVFDHSWINKRLPAPPNLRACTVAEPCPEVATDAR
jgi:hypothetical protein